MGVEQKINFLLNRCPAIKKVVKRAYQLAMYAVSPKIKSEGNIVRVSPDDGKEYFFGYYDKSPWDASGRYMLCMRANNTWSDVSPREKADIIIIDTQKSEADPERVTKIGETSAWNVQQACMLQWLGPDFQSRVLFNDFRDGRFCSVILDIKTKEERVIEAPVYTVSNDGSFALTLDFTRLYSLRPGYGYYNLPEKTKGVALPDETCIWTVDLESGDIRPLLKYTDFANFEPRKEMQESGSVHKVNHLMLSPDGKRFMTLYRWFNGQRKYTRLVTCNVDGSEMYVLSDDDMVSHCYWKNNEEILAFENKRDGGPGYYLMKDKSQEYMHLWTQLCNDGHPSYSPDKSLVVTDSYPNRARVQELKILKDSDIYAREMKVVAKVFAPFKYDNDTRCDLHPRWSRDGKKICFDSVFEGHRGLYVVEVPDNLKTENLQESVSQEAKVSCIIPSYKRCDTVTRAIDSVLAQTYKNIEVCLVDDNIPGDEYSLKLQEALKKYEGDSRVRYIAQEKHINGAVARNVGIREATGTYIGFLDDDDEWMPEKVEQQMRILQADATIDAVTTFWIRYNNGREIRRCSPYTANDFQFKVLLRDIAVFTSTILIKKSSIESFGGFDEKLLRHQDLQFLVNASQNSKFQVLPEYLTKLHADSDINRPNVEKLIEAKKAFFKSVANEIKQYDKSEQKRIKNAHCYEVVLFALKAKKYLIVVKYCLKAGINIQSLKDLVKRYLER